MDLICCRNLLIYFEPVLQTRVVSLFSYALRSGGHLVLGASEGVSAGGPLFNVENRENKIFVKKASSTRQIVTFSLTRPVEHAADDAPWLAQTSRADSNWNSPEWQRDFDRRLLAHYVPPAVFVNEDLEIVHTRGRFDRYFKMPPGRPTLNLLKMAVEDLSVPLQSAILAAKKEKRLVHRKGITLRLPNGKKGASREEVVSLEVVPVKSAMNELCFMIVFLEEDNSQAKGGSRGKRRVDSSSKRYRRLEEELQATKERLQSVVENLEVTNEELQSANEEILSSNEELQSTNEELETAKEELQSTNEELSTVNDELRSRNSLISDAQKDVRDLLTGISVTVVGKDMKVREFAPPARKFLNLLPDDISDLLDAHDAPDIPDLYALVKLALHGNGAAPVEVSDRAGKKYRVRVIPYGGSVDKPEGFIVTLTDSSISARLSKRALSSD
jgi:two-component system CheB/CheR fusion protein